MGGAGRSRLPEAHGPAVPLVQRGLRLVRRFPRRPRLPQAQGAEEGAARGARPGHHRGAPHRPRHHRGALGRVLGLLHGHRVAQMGPALSDADFLLTDRERMADRVLLVMAKRAGRYIAARSTSSGPTPFYGRNWGCNRAAPFLHFEVCYHQAIDFAIARGLSRVEAGAQGEHKLARGYRPVTTYSAHDIADPALRRAIADYLRHEREHVAAINEELERWRLFGRVREGVEGRIPPTSLAAATIRSFTACGSAMLNSVGRRHREREGVFLVAQRHPVVAQHDRPAPVRPGLDVDAPKLRQRHRRHLPVLEDRDLVVGERIGGAPQPPRPQPRIGRGTTTAAPPAPRRRRSSEGRARRRPAPASARPP